MNRNLPQKLYRELTSPPHAGQGVHQWLFRMARKLHRVRRPEAIVEILAAAVSKCGRQVPEREILDAVENSRPGRLPCNLRGNTVRKASAPKWSAMDEHLRSRILADSPQSLAELTAQSPLTITDDHSANWFIGRLFHPTDLLCIGLSNCKFTTRPAADFLGVELFESCLLVPSPMSAKWGVTRQGRRSQHTLSNTGPRRYLVTEFDNGTQEEQTAIINHLRDFAPLVMVLSSGGKSLHAWWNCVGSEDWEHQRFFAYAVTLGADPATWTKSQFVRLPQGWRADKNARQRVFYFDEGNLPNSTGERRDER